jgi:hypothetical protein
MQQATQTPLAAFQVEVYLLIGLTEVGWLNSRVGRWLGLDSAWSRRRSCSMANAEDGTQPLSPPSCAPRRPQIISVAAPRPSAGDAAIAAAASTFLRAASASAAAAVAWPRRLPVGAPGDGAPAWEHAGAPGASTPLLQTTLGAANSSARCPFPEASGAFVPDAARSGAVWSKLMSAELPASLHLPLHRAAAHALAAALRLEQAAPRGGALRGELGRAAAGQLARWHWEPLCIPLLAARGLVAQSEGQLWVRNGDDVLTDVHYYNSTRWVFDRPFDQAFDRRFDRRVTACLRQGWSGRGLASCAALQPPLSTPPQTPTPRDLMADPDWLLLQGWLATAAATGAAPARRALAAWLNAFGQAPLMQAMGGCPRGRASGDGDAMVARGSRAGGGQRAPQDRRSRRRRLPPPGLGPQPCAPAAPAARRRPPPRRACSPPSAPRPRGSGSRRRSTPSSRRCVTAPRRGSRRRLARARRCCTGSRSGTTATST